MSYLGCKKHTFPFCYLIYKLLVMDPESSGREFKSEGGVVRAERRILTSKKVETSRSVNTKSNISVLSLFLSQSFLLFCKMQGEAPVGFSLPILSTSNQEADPLIPCKTDLSPRFFTTLLLL